MMKIWFETSAEAINICVVCARISCATKIKWWREAYRFLYVYVLSGNFASKERLMLFSNDVLMLWRRWNNTTVYPWTVDQWTFSWQYPKLARQQSDPHDQHSTKTEIRTDHSNENQVNFAVTNKHTKRRRRSRQSSAFANILDVFFFVLCSRPTTRWWCRWCRRRWQTRWKSCKCQTSLSRRIGCRAWCLCQWHETVNGNSNVMRWCWYTPITSYKQLDSSNFFSFTLKHHSTKQKQRRRRKNQQV